MSLDFWSSFTKEQKDRFQELKNKEEISSFLEKEKIQLTEEQMKQVVGGEGPETKLPEIFD